MSEEPLTSWAEAVRLYDPERFVTCLFAPAERREALLALLAFNLEVAKTAEVVSEPMLGQIRLQWWRESLDGLYGGQPRQHEVVEVLSGAIERYDLPRAPFDRLLDARELDLESDPPADLAALEDYAEATGGTLVELALAVLAGPSPPPAPALAAGRSVGAAWSLVGLLRAMPFHAGARRLYLPADLVAEAGVDLAALFELRPTAAHRNVVARIAERAEERLTEARAPRREVPRALRPALLPAVLAEGHLKRLRRAGHDPFAPEVQAKPAGTAWRLALRAWRGRY